MLRLRLKNTTLDELLDVQPRFQDEAQVIRPRGRREQLIRKARRANAASQLREWLSSPGLRPPT